jgi:hypothetical protein
MKKGLGVSALLSPTSLGPDFLFQFHLSYYVCSLTKVPSSSFWGKKKVE